jgi:hypothetical protein
METKIYALVFIAILAVSSQIMLTKAEEPTYHRTVLYTYARPSAADYSRPSAADYYRPSAANYTHAGRARGNVTVAKDNNYYELLGPKWGGGNMPVVFTINPTYGPEGSVNEIRWAAETWDDATNMMELFRWYFIDYFAKPSVNYPDWRNVVCWGNLSEYHLPRWPTVQTHKAIVVAATVLWWYDLDKSGTPSRNDYFIDCDIIFNTQVKWGIDPDGEGSEKMPQKNAFDVRSAATHEFGHALVGLADLYKDKYSELTMYSYTTPGETKKISLQRGDIYGVWAQYGAGAIPPKLPD